MRRTLVYFLTKLLWPAYSKQGENYSIGIIVKHFLIQKILRINSHVPWPVHPTSTIKSPHKIIPGSRTPGITAGCHIDGRNGIIIGSNVWIGPRVSIISMNHDINSYQNYIFSQPVIIRDNCWLATNCVILAGVELGEHTVVSAGAVVTKTFLDGNVVLGGVPAKVIKRLDIYNKVGCKQRG